MFAPFLGLRGHCVNNPFVNRNLNLFLGKAFIPKQIANTAAALVGDMPIELDVDDDINSALGQANEKDLVDLAGKKHNISIATLSCKLNNISFCKVFH